MNKRWVSAIIAVLFIAVVGIARSANPPVDSGPFDGCAPPGVGGDPELNTQKNRSQMPQTYAQVTVAQLRAMPKVARSLGKSRNAWPAPTRLRIQKLEANAGAFEGYIIHAKPEGPESSNCKLSGAQDHDVHVYVADTPGEDASTSAIVEVTPRWRNTNPSWNAQALQKLADSGAHVRISGLALYDQDHWDMISKHQRGTLWELHPITKIEVETTAGWVELEKYVTLSSASLLPGAGPQLVHTRTTAQAQAAMRGATLLL